MNDKQCRAVQPTALWRLQSWLSPAFPTGAYSYSHGLEWAVEAGYVSDRPSLVDWLEADLCHGSGRNEAIFFSEAWRCTVEDDRAQLFDCRTGGRLSRNVRIRSRIITAGGCVSRDPTPGLARSHPGLAVRNTPPARGS